MTTTTALQLFDAGYTDLVSVIPPGAKLSAQSKIPDGSDPKFKDQRGKAPGRKNGNVGTWGGYDWQDFKPLREHVKLWQEIHQANIGLHARNFPAVDIDCLDADATRLIAETAVRVLGAAPMRIGRAPKTLLVYGAATPFTRLRLHFWRPGQEQEKNNPLVEILGDGQQYLVAGIHPVTMQPYEWVGKPLHEYDPLDDLALIDLAKANAFLDELEVVLDLAGWETKRDGGGRLASENGLVQEHLAAPSEEAVIGALAAIPNTHELWPSRDAMNQVGYAVKASLGDAGLVHFIDWAMRYNDAPDFASDQPNNPEWLEHEWERMVPPFRIGWEWLVAQAKRLGGYSDVGDDFEADATLASADDFDAPGGPPAPPPPPPPTVTTPSGDPAPPKYSDYAVAQRFEATFGGRFKFVKPLGGWQAYSESKGTWAPDESNKAEAAMQRVCSAYADIANADGNLNPQLKRSVMLGLTKAGTVTNALNVAKARRAFSDVLHSDFDRNVMLLNTPDGVVDLATGALLQHAPDGLHTKTTAVAPRPGAPIMWLAFLQEAMGGDQELITWVQIMAGYWLTGKTNEQQLTFLWGDGGNGKGVFGNTIANVMGDYAMRTPSTTFAVQRNEAHAEGMARLRGARLVLASETPEGTVWDEAKVKGATGGDVITARFMQQNSFDYVPQFKLLFLGNSKPRIRTLDRAMKRRIHMVEMNNKPRQVNTSLTEMLEAEWPQILQWAIEGCTMWVKGKLAVPAVVKAATQEYFGEEDIVGQFIEDCCDTTDARGFTSSMALWKAWERWAVDNGEVPRTVTWFSKQIRTHNFEKINHHPILQVRGFYGIKLLNDDEFEAVSDAVPPKAKAK